MAAQIPGIGLAALPLVDPLLDPPPTADQGPATTPTESVFVFTHFAPDTYGALSFTATNGDRCWRAVGERPSASAAPDWVAHLLFALKGPPPPPGGWDGAGLGLDGCWEAKRHSAEAKVFGVDAPPGVPPNSLRLQAEWPPSGAMVGGGPAAAAAAAAAPPVRGRVYLAPVEGEADKAGARAAVLAAAVATAAAASDALERLERLAEGADGRAAAAEARAEESAHQLVAQQEALFAAAAAVVNEKKAALVAAEARAAAVVAGGGAAPGPGLAASGPAAGGWVLPGGGGGARPPPPPPPDAAVAVDGNAADHPESGSEAGGGSYAGSGSSGDREAAGLEADTQPLEDGALRALAAGEGYMDEDGV
jgi:hypothetical protein